VLTQTTRDATVREQRAQLQSPRRTFPFASLLRTISRPAHLRVISRDLLAVVRRSQSDLDHLRETMAWLCRAQDVAGYGGVSAGYYFADGWLPPYPETTGYIIETFLDYAAFTCDHSYFDRAVRMGDWETTIQLPSGGVRAGIGLNDEPIVFNTGQVILGWVRLYRATGQERYLEAAKTASNWLASIQDCDGKWSRLTHNNIPHAYHSRVAWPLLEAFGVTQISDYKRAAIANIRWVLEQANENAWFDNAAFNAGEPPLTHTIAYTLRGLLEASAHLTGSFKDQVIETVQTAAETLMTRFERSKRNPYGRPRLLPATFDENWRSTATSSCLTGNAQIAIIWMKLYRLIGDVRFLNAALKILDLVKGTQCLNSGHPGIRGGLAGASVIWGSYERLAYPNWAAKFLADAIMLQESVMNDLSGDRS